jgi:tetratricopeptide (TPR) repeat protein
LARFAANADLDIHWACNSNLAYEAEKDMLRKRPVTLYMSSATTQQFLTVAAGCVGILARLDAPRSPYSRGQVYPRESGGGDKLAPAERGGAVTIFNPFEYTSLSEHRAQLSEEAVSLWQIFLLTSGDKERIGNAHFALGLLKARQGCLTDAIAEYKLVANRYPAAPVAPYALLASSKLKVDLLDYFGARDDLKQLIEQYPDTEPDEIGLEPAQGFALANEARLYLADATMKAGLLSEAARLYCKVHNLGFSLESQRISALGAGRCFYEEKDYENAAKWLIRYINLSKDSTDRDLYLACFLLGKTYLALDLPEQACKAFESALGGFLGQHVMQEYVGTVSALVKVHIQQGQFVEALKLLDKSISWQLSQKESIEILLLKASTLRSIGLADEAIAVLGDKAEYMLEMQLKAKIFFEQAKCFIAKDNLELARKSLSEILVLVEPGPLAQEVRCELADVCLKLGQDSQAISICLQLLDSAPENPIKQRALDLLAAAYTKQKKYDQAALALLGQSQ